MSRWLSGHGVTLLTAGSSKEALVLLEETEGVNVVVSDYHMRGINGVELLNRIEQRWPLARRILYTAHADSELVLEAVRHKVLTKQMDMHLVRDAILREAKRVSNF